MEASSAAPLDPRAEKEMQRKKSLRNLKRIVSIAQWTGDLFGSHGNYVDGHIYLSRSRLISRPAEHGSRSHHSQPPQAGRRSSVSRRDSVSRRGSVSRTEIAAGTAPSRRRESVSRGSEDDTRTTSAPALSHTWGHSASSSAIPSSSAPSLSASATPASAAASWQTPGALSAPGRTAPDFRDFPAFRPADSSGSSPTLSDEGAGAAGFDFGHESAGSPLLRPISSSASFRTPHLEETFGFRPDSPLGGGPTPGFTVSPFDGGAPFSPTSASSTRVVLPRVRVSEPLNPVLSPIDPMRALPAPSPFRVSLPYIASPEADLSTVNFGMHHERTVVSSVGLPREALEPGRLDRGRARPATSGAEMTVPELEGAAKAPLERDLSLRHFVSKWAGEDEGVSDDAYATAVRHAVDLAHRASPISRPVTADFTGYLSPRKAALRAARLAQRGR